MKKIILIVLGILFFLMLALVMYVQMAEDPRSILEIKPNKNKKYLAYSHLDSGVGYCSFTTSIIQLGGDMKYFNFHGGQSIVFETSICTEDFSIHWVEGEKFKLLIQCPDLGGEFRTHKLDQFKEVSITYENC